MREQAIQKRAYAIPEEEGRAAGNDLDDGLHVEAEIISAAERQANPSLSAKH
jgi:hypothetical protein